MRCATRATPRSSRAGGRREATRSAAILGFVLGAGTVVLALSAASGQSGPAARDRRLDRLAWRPIPELSYRKLHAMAYDPLRQRVVLFGGLQFTGGQVLGDTWEWNGRRWRPMRPLHSPPPRMMPGMAYDPQTKRVLLFGGANRSTDFADTWAWDGRDWTRLHPARSPKGRFDSGMVTDPRRRRVVLHGGAYLPPNAWRPITVGETWEWDGRSWVQRFPKTDPGRRRGMGFAFHARSGKVVRFGGWIDTARPIDTWEWDGSDWRQRHPAASPTDAAVALAPDPTSGDVVCLQPDFRAGVYLTWIWDGTTWRKQGPKPPPTLVANIDTRLCEDVARRQVIHHGWTARGGGRQTWAWDGQGWHLRAAWSAPRNAQWVVPGWDGAHDQILLPNVLSDKKQWETWALRGDHLVRLLASSPRMWGLAYDARMGKLIGVGEIPSTSQNLGTYSWDGQAWMAVRETARPPKVGGALVYDARRDVMVLYNGNWETWEWRQGLGWNKVSTVSKPVLFPFDLAYDMRRGKVVCCGGRLHSARNDVDIWEWDGKRWQERKVAVRPPDRSRLRIEYVPDLGGVVLFASERMSSLADTWVWNGVQWDKLTIPPYPHERGVFNSYSSAYDAGRRRLILTYSHMYLQTAPNGIWALSFGELETTQPHPRPGESFAIDAQIAGAAGAPLLLALSATTWPGIPLAPRAFGFEILPLTPDGLFWASLQAGIGGVLDRRGHGRLPLRIPNDARLRGATFWVGGLRFGSGPRMLRATNAVRIDVPD